MLTVAVPGPLPYHGAPASSTCSWAMIRWRRLSLPERSENGPKVVRLCGMLSTSQTRPAAMAAPPKVPSRRPSSTQTATKTPASRPVREKHSASPTTIGTATAARTFVRSSQKKTASVPSTAMK